MKYVQDSVLAEELSAVLENYTTQYCLVAKQNDTVEKKKSFFFPYDIWLSIYMECLMCSLILMIMANSIRRRNLKPCILNVTDQPRSLNSVIYVQNDSVSPVACWTHQSHSCPTHMKLNVMITCSLVPELAWAHERHPQNSGFISLKIRYLKGQ